MKKNLVYLLIFFFISASLFSQEWIQTASTPEGAGITEIVVHPDNNHIFVTTASLNWPNGDDGGIRRSINDGDSWENLFDAYVGRTITLGADGNFYASVWPYPSDEGLYRSLDNGDTWDLLVTVPNGNNIFSITVNITTKENTIFAGTRQGVYRSLDNGVNWAYVNNGIPADTWVRDIEVDDIGIVVAATSNGLFSSEDNGELWQKATGDGIENEYMTKIVFDYPFNKEGNNTRLIGGSSDGNIFEAFRDSRYLSATMLAIFDGVENSGMWIAYLEKENLKMHGVSNYYSNGGVGGFIRSIDGGQTWIETNNGLPASPNASALFGSSNETEVNFRIGLFQNMNGGAKVFKISFPWSAMGTDNFTIDNSSELYLQQNSPNPFSNITDINYFLSEAAPTSLKIYSIDGMHVSTLVESCLPRGDHHISWMSEDMDSGIYYYVLQSGSNIEIKKMIKQ